MAELTLIKADVVIGEGATQILIEKQFVLARPLLKVVDEQFDVDIYHTEVCEDKVIFNGVVQKNLIYKTPVVPAGNPSGWRDDNNNPYSLDGDVVFHEEVLQFAGFVSVDGAQAGDDVQIIEAAVKECTAFIPTKEENGLVLEGKQKFIVDVGIKVTRHEQIYILAEEPVPPCKSSSTGLND
jgi:hypothetical protein